MTKHREKTLDKKWKEEGEAPSVKEKQEETVENSGREAAFLAAPEVPFTECDWDQYFRKLEIQAQAARAFYPDLDLGEELRDPLFARLIQPQVGMEVGEAYGIVHREKLMEAMMAYAVRRARESISLAVQAGSLRPRENGAGGETRPMQEDPRKWSPQRRKELKERVRRGERITF